MIYFALRDENWGTTEAYIENEILTLHDDCLSIHYDCFHRNGNVNNFHWKASIQSSPSGKNILEIQGEALTDILKNRAEFCILHPIKETVVQPCEILHFDGNISKLTFPEFVSLQNLYNNIGSIHWAADNHRVELNLDGDILKLKINVTGLTTCTLLDLPLPVT